MQLVIDEKVRKEILKNALKNASDYGSAKDGPVISKVLFEFPELRSSMAELKAEVSKTVSLINGMDRAKLEEEYEIYKAGFDDAERKKAEGSKPKFIADGATVGMSVGEEKKTELEPKDAFGERNPELSRVMHLSDFRKRDMDPYPGMQVDIDGFLSPNASFGSSSVFFSSPTDMPIRTVSSPFMVPFFPNITSWGL